MLFGEKMPDRNDPKYKERYERDIDAGRRFAKATRIDKAAAKVQGLRQHAPDAVSRHRIWLRHLRADMEYLPPDGGVPPSSDPPDGHGDAGFRAPGTA